MNGYGGTPVYSNTAQMPSMSPNYPNQAPPPSQGIPNLSAQFPDATPPPQVYSGTSPTIYSSDTFAIVEPYYNWQAPLVFDNPPPASDPYSYTAFPWIEDYYSTPTPQTPEVDYGIQQSVWAAGLPSTPFYQDVTAEQWIIPSEPPGYGPLDWAWDALTGVGDWVWDTGKALLENLDINVNWAETGQNEQQKAAAKYYESLGAAQKTAAEAARIKAQAYADQVAAGTMTMEEAMARSNAEGINTLASSMPASPVILTTQQPQAAGPNYLLYGAIAIAAYYFLR